jgi:hypothetical protein
LFFHGGTVSTATEKCDFYVVGAVYDRACSAKAYTYKVSPQNDDFNLDLTFTAGQKDRTRPIATVVAAGLIVFIILTMTTGVASALLPMSDQYLLVMIPTAPDGAEPLGLKSLTYQTTDDKTITVNGSVANRTAEPMSNVLAVVEIQDTTGRFPQTVEVPLEPPDLAPQAAGSFTAMATLQEKVGAYIVKFRFADGPSIPHKDERTPDLAITPQLQTK